MYQTLYRKYRPNNFNEVVGQNVIIQTLKNATKKNTLNHAYLFTGPRGTGKTSVAKIFAKTINCNKLNEYMPCNNCVNCTQINNKQYLDIIEIDAASNNGVDEIRELKSKVNLVPTIGKYKVYIIDEVHMLTTGAFNALLKTLEEPPEHIIFILATTEPHKIPVTILSRCQRFDFKKIASDDIKKYLEIICEKEKLKIEEEALIEISEAADGGMRDALSILDQVIAYSDNKITLENVHEINGTITKKNIDKFLKYLIANDIENIFNMIDEFEKNGKNFTKLIDEIILYLKELLLNTILKKNQQNISTNLLLKYIKKFNASISNIKISQNTKLIFEITILDILSDYVENETTEKEIIQTQNEINEVKNIKNSNEKNSVNLKQKKIISIENIEQIKEIRINNTLCNFNKKELNEWIRKIKQVEKYLLNAKYSEIISLILDSKLKAASDKNIILVFETERLSKILNNNLKLLDEIMEKIYNEKIYIIAVNKNEWDNIKSEYNNKTKKYTYDKNQEYSNENKDHLKHIFGEIVEYK